MLRIVEDGLPIPKQRKSKPKTSSGDSITKRSGPTIVIATQDGLHVPSANQQDEDAAGNHEESEGPFDKSTPAPVQQANRDPDPVSASRVGTQDQEEPTRLVEVFLRILRSYRQQLFQIYGSKCEAMIRQAEQEVRFLNPDFSLDDLRDETAPVLLDLFEVLIREASLLRRTRLREGALLLVADLYNKNYDLLSRHNLIDRVETAYYRLKK